MKKILKELIDHHEFQASEVMTGLKSISTTFSKQAKRDKTFDEKKWKKDTKACALSLKEMHLKYAKFLKTLG